MAATLLLALKKPSWAIRELVTDGENIFVHEFLIRHALIKNADPKLYAIFSRLTNDAMASDSEEQLLSEHRGGVLAEGNSVLVLFEFRLYGWKQ